MKSVKLTLEVSTASAVEQAIANIEAGNKMQSQGKALADKGKAFLASQLLVLRGIEVAKLPVGEVVGVSVNDAPAFNVVIGKQNRLDLAALEAEQPDIANTYKRDFPTVSFKRAA